MTETIKPRYEIHAIPEKPAILVFPNATQAQLKLFKKAIEQTFPDRTDLMITNQKVIITEKKL